MSITSVLKEFWHAHIDGKLAGLIRAEDGAIKLDVAVSEIVDVETIITNGTDNADVEKNEDDDTNLDETNGLVVDGVLYARIDADKVKPVRMDGSTHSLQTVTYAHKEIHSSTHYVCRSYEAIAKAGVVELLVVTPDTTKWGHMVIGFDVISSQAVVQLFEGVTVSDNGILENSRNRNRNSPDNNTLLIYNGPTVTGGAVAGNIIQDGIFGAGRNSFGGGARDNEELMQKQNTIYLLRFTEQNINATFLNFSFDWYEHTDKD